ncbi:DUF3592 domain-containing protein [Burkholderia sp. 22PA0099]|uniref:DUF3592 domain-containing protein n=1 Tax=Burkholderia sp. 22PA0099 TaxID=3237372 RepID=UPI0039C17897
MRRPNHLFLVVGAVLAIVAAGITWRTVDYRLSSTVVTGTVVRLLAGGHHPEVAFDAPDGTHHTRPIGTWRSLEPGQRVPVRLRAATPEASASIDTEVDIWGVPVFLCVLAAAFLWSGIRGAPTRGRYG